MSKLFKKFVQFLKQQYTCDNCGPRGWKAPFIGMDGWKMKDGSYKWLCRDCSGHRSFFP